MCGRSARRRWALGAMVGGLALGGCQSAGEHYAEADDVTARIIEHKQLDTLGRTEPFTIDRPSDTFRRRLLATQGLPVSGAAALGVEHLMKVDHWPTDAPAVETSEQMGRDVPWPADASLVITLDDALRIAALNSREYQTAKESVFESALALDLADDQFRTSFFGTIASVLSTDLSTDPSPAGVENGAAIGGDQRLKNGARLMGNIGVDLAKLLTDPRESSYGVVADFTITMPLLAGSGEHIVTEPLTQAERNVEYALQRFERFKHTFAVSVASQYLSVLQQHDQVDNAAENYRRLIESTNRARRLSQAGGRLSEIQVDQAEQDELRARDGWVGALASYQSALDDFKITLGLPTDAVLELDESELDRLAATAKGVMDRMIKREEGAEIPPAGSEIVLEPPTREVSGRYELEESRAVSLAFGHRLDLRTAHGQVYDAQRKVVVAADALRAGLDVSATGRSGEGRGLGSATLSDGQLRPEKGAYAVGLALDLPWERTAERNAYRLAYIDLESAIRQLQELEDTIKQQIRNGLRNLERTRESFRIQYQAVQLAERRVRSTNIFLRAGRAEIRDLLEAQEDLLNAQDALTEALVEYRISELELQRDMGVLDVDEQGLWREFDVQAP